MKSRDFDNVHALAPCSQSFSESGSRSGSS